MYVLCVLIYIIINEYSSFRNSHVHCTESPLIKNVSSYSKLIFKVDKIGHLLYFHVHSEHFFQNKK